MILILAGGTNAMNRTILIFHTQKPFMSWQKMEIEKHAWLEMEKIGLMLEKHNLTFADLARGFDIPEEELITQMSKQFACEWITRYAPKYREWHWEKIHPMPDVVLIPPKN